MFYFLFQIIKHLKKDETITKCPRCSGCSIVHTQNSNNYPITFPEITTLSCASNKSRSKSSSSLSGSKISLIKSFSTNSASKLNEQMQNQHQEQLARKSLAKKASIDLFENCDKIETAVTTAKAAANGSKPCTEYANCTKCEYVFCIKCLCPYPSATCHSKIIDMDLFERRPMATPGVAGSKESKQSLRRLASLDNINRRK